MTQRWIPPPPPAPIHHATPGRIRVLGMVSMKLVPYRVSKAKLNLLTTSARGCLLLLLMDSNANQTKCVRVSEASKRLQGKYAQCLFFFFYTSSVNLHGTDRVRQEVRHGDKTTCGDDRLCFTSRDRPKKKKKKRTHLTS